MFIGQGSRYGFFFFFSSRRRHTRCLSDWSSDVCSSDLWSLGIEEEVLILDGGSLALVPGVQTILEAVEERELPGVLKMELLASMVELATGVCETPQEALAALGALRAAADEAARVNGLRVAAAGTHPFSLPQAQDVAPDPRYREFVEYAGISARRQAVCGL